MIRVRPNAALAIKLQHHELREEAFPALAIIGPSRDNQARVRKAFQYRRTKYSRDGLGTVGHCTRGDRRAVPASAVSNCSVNVSGANEISGSQTGSQQRQASGDAQRRLAIVTAGEWHVQPRPASFSDVAIVPPKQ